MIHPDYAKYIQYRDAYYEALKKDLTAGGVQDFLLRVARKLTGPGTNSFGPGGPTRADLRDRPNVGPL